MRRVVSSTPWGVRWQGRSRAFFPMLLGTTSSDGFLSPLGDQLCPFCFFRRSTSSALHEKMHIDSCRRKEYSWCEFVVQPDAEHLMKCQMSRRTCTFGQPGKRSDLVLQQSGSMPQGLWPSRQGHDLLLQSRPSSAPVHSHSPRWWPMLQYRRCVQQVFWLPVKQWYKL